MDEPPSDRRWGSVPVVLMDILTVESRRGRGYGGRPASIICYYEDRQVIAATTDAPLAAVLLAEAFLLARMRVGVLPQPPDEGERVSSRGTPDTPATGSVGRSTHPEPESFGGGDVQPGPYTPW